MANTNAAAADPLLLSAAAVLGDAPALPLCPDLANLSTLSLARSLAGDRAHLRGLERILAAGTFTYYLTADDCRRSIVTTGNRIARDQSRLADLMTPALGARCPLCPGKMTEHDAGSFECDPCGERFAVECGVLTHLSTCAECGEQAVTADCLTDNNDDRYCDECCEASRERYYQRTGRLR